MSASWQTVCFRGCGWTNKPCLWPADFSTVWQYAHLVLKIFSPAFSFPSGASDKVAIASRQQNCSSRLSTRSGNKTKPHHTTPHHTKLRKSAHSDACYAKFRRRRCSDDACYAKLTDLYFTLKWKVGPGYFAAAKFPLSFFLCRRS